MIRLTSLQESAIALFGIFFILVFLIIVISFAFEFVTEPDA